MSSFSQKVLRGRRRFYYPMALAIITLQAQTPRSYAQPRTFAYEGIVESAVGGAEFEELVGRLLFFQFTYDAGTTDTNPDPSVGEFPAISSIQACIGPGGNVVRYHEDSGNVTLTDSADPDVSTSVSVIGGLATPDTGTGWGGLDLTRAGMTLGQSLTPFSTSALPTVQPDPTNFVGNELFIEWGDGAGRISATDLRITDPVPEPTTLGLLLVGVLFAGRRNWRM